MYKETYDNTIVQFGGTGWTLAKNEGKTLEEGDRIEKLYKELHPGIYQYGENKIKEAMDLGYIESCMGFKLHLPNYEEFKRLELVNKNIDWELYREGKEIYKAEKKALESKKEYTITNYYCYNYYLKHYKNVKRYFKIKSKYFRLVLNNPTQTTAAHQTKLAVSTLFQFIKDNNHIDKVCICIVPHDEIVLECIDELVPLYTQKLGEIMITCGNKLIKNPKILMKAEAHSGLNWYEAK